MKKNLYFNLDNFFIIEIKKDLKTNKTRDQLNGTKEEVTERNRLPPSLD